MTPDVITVLKNNVVITQPVGNEILVAMAVAASASNTAAANVAADRSEAALAEIVEFAAAAPDAPSIANKQNLITSAGPMVPSPAAASFPRADTERWATRLAVAGQDFGVPASGDCAPSINAIIQDLGRRGGGILDLPLHVVTVESTIDNNVPRVLVRGFGHDSPHDAGLATYGTQIIANFVGTVLKHRTPYGVGMSRNSGGGFIGMSVGANGVATRLLEVNSVADSEYDVFLQNSVGTEAALFTCGVTGVDIPEAADTQRVRARIRFRQLDGTAAANAMGVVLSGSSNANTSKCDFFINGQHKNGIAVDLVNADNNILNIGAFRAAGGTGIGVMNRGGTAAFGGYARANLFAQISAASIIFEGTDTSGVLTASNGVVMFRDTDNGTPTAVLGVGCRVLDMSSDGMLEASAILKAFFGQTTADRTSAEASGNLRPGVPTFWGAFDRFFDLASANGRIEFENSGGDLVINRPGTPLRVNLRGSYDLLSALGRYCVDGVNVVGPQGAPVANATDASSAITQLNALLSRLRTHGLIAS